MLRLMLYVQLKDVNMHGNWIENGKIEHLQREYNSKATIFAAVPLFKCGR